MGNSHSSGGRGYGGKSHGGSSVDPAIIGAALSTTGNYSSWI